MRALTGAAWLLAAFATPVLSNYYNGTTYPMSVEQRLTTKDVCPDDCPTTGLKAGDWSAILSLQELDKCSQAMLFSTSVRFPIESADRPTYIQACTVPSGFAEAKVETPACVTATNQTSTKVDLQVGWSNGNGAKASLTQVLAAASQLQRAAINDGECDATILFAKSGSAILGLYAGAEVERSSVGKMVQEYIDYMHSRDAVLPEELSLQACGGNDTLKSATHIVGIYTSTIGDVKAVHKALGQWAQAKCVPGSDFDKTDTLANRKLTFLSGVAVTAAARKTLSTRSLEKRAACSKYVMVQSGDTCQALADRCGISMNAFVHYNGNGDNSFCSTLQIDTPECCNAGDPPDLRPQKNSDGTCVTYIVAANDLCYNINKKFYLKDGDLDKFNVGKTWGYAGCEKLIPNQKLCVSDGSPPMPTWIKNAVCGPQVPGTKRPTNDTSLADLNQCPIKACCNIWGQCGTTEDFCIDTTIANTPGTAANGTYGCVSNCGMDIFNNDKGPASFSQVAYFEAWNHERKCLHMDVSAVGKPYTHIHFAFGDISDGDFVVSAKGVEDQFRELVRMRGIKRIMSLGGWAFSNEGTTNHIMRDGVKPENRQKFATNVVNFVNDNGLDGIDFDWEYPGADDIPGSDPGTPEDGPNYLEFLKLVRAGIGGKSISIATPASYWYLRHFPIDEMSKVIDYTVYMTYDFHGQWDVDNKFVSPGCPGGNCLRSHVNKTETQNALSMITKAGMPTNKIMVGVSSYGRSFKMAQAGCTGPMCTYLGGRNQSPAEPGECTETGGYIADAEIAGILADKKRVTTTYWDEYSDTDVVVYDDVQWVAHMTNVTKERRRNRYQQLNFAGTSDWAVDLQGNVSSSGGDVVYIGTEVYTSHSMHCTAPCTIVLAPSPLGSTTTISIPPYTTSLQAGTETVTVTIKPTPITTDSVDFYNIPISSNEATTTPIQPYPSLEVPDATVTFTYTVDTQTKTSTRIVALPPWPLITNGPPPSGSDWDHPPPLTSTGVFVKPSNTKSPDPPPSTEDPTYTWGWNTVPGRIEPLPTNPPKVECENNCDEDDDTGLVTVDFPCDIWFFNTCPDGDDDDHHGGHHGWRISFPPGRIGPGPPPPGLIKPPSGFHIVGPLPPWPPITFPKGGGSPPDTPDEPDECETESASICGTTTSYGSSVAPGGKTVTTTSSVYSTCNTIYGCSVEDDDSTTTTGGECNLARRALPTFVSSNAIATSITATTTRSGSASPVQTGVRRVEKQIIEEQTVESPRDRVEATETAKEHLRARAPSNCQTYPAIIVPHDITNAKSIDTYLNGKVSDGTLANYKAVRGYAGQPDEYFAWFFVKDFPTDLHDDAMNNVPEIKLIYNPVDYWRQMQCTLSTAASVDLEDDEEFANITKRDGSSRQSADYANAFMSQPRNQRHLYGDEGFFDSGSSQYNYHLDDSEGQGQDIYMIESALSSSYGSWAEFRGSNVVRPIFVPNYYPDYGGSEPHGSAVLSTLVGQTVGVVKKARVIPVLHEVPANSPYIFSLFHALIMVLDDIRSSGNPGTSVVTFAWGVRSRCMPEAFLLTVLQILQMYDDQDILLVASAGNDGDATTVEHMFPASVVMSMGSGIVAGNVNRYGLVSDTSTRNDANTEGLQIFAAGEKVLVVKGGGPLSLSSGTSYSGPRIAGLAAYLRAIPSKYATTLTSGFNVKTMIQTLQGYLQPEDVPDSFKGTDYPTRHVWAVRHVWNGQVPPDPSKPGSKSRSCLLEDEIEFGNNCNICPDLSHFAAPNPKRDNKKRLAACTLPGNGGNGGDGGDGGDLNGLPVPGPIGWSEGDPSPTCTANCGTACEGFFCVPQPTGTPPDFEDPDPDDNKPPPTGGGDPPGGDDPPPTGGNDPPPELAKPDPSKNTVDCYNSGQKSSYDKIDYAAQSFCRDVVSYRSTWSNDKLEEKKTPPGNYHFQLFFQVFDNCVWEANYDECMRYIHVPIDSCDCSAKGDKQGGTMSNNCIGAGVDPNYGQ